MNGPHSDTWKDLRGYYIPKKLLKQNETNILAVRVKDYEWNGGIIEGPVGFISMEKYIDFWRNKKSNNW
jgi:hypothetical protein